jgi:hypothetical protein
MSAGLFMPLRIARIAADSVGAPGREAILIEREVRRREIANDGRRETRRKVAAMRGVACGLGVHRSYCVFRRDPGTDSGRIRALIPEGSGH